MAAGTRSRTSAGAPHQQYRYRLLNYRKVPEYRFCAGAPLMLEICHIDHVVLRVKDLQQMLDFYRSVLGCELVKADSSIGLYEMRAGASQLDLVPVDGVIGRHGGAAPGDSAANMDHLCLRIKAFDSDAILAHLSHHGVAAGAVEIRHGADGYGPSIYLDDPEGNRIELKGPPAAIQNADSSVTAPPGHR